MPTRSQICSTSERTCDETKIVAPRLRASAPAPRTPDGEAGRGRSSARRGEKSGLVRERRRSASFCLLPCEYSRYLRERSSRAASRRRDLRVVHVAAQSGQVTRRLRAAPSAELRELARDVADLLLDRDRHRDRRPGEDRCRPRVAGVIALSSLIVVVFPRRWVQGSPGPRPRSPRGRGRRCPPAPKSSSGHSSRSRTTCRSLFCCGARAPVLFRVRRASAGACMKAPSRALVIAVILRLTVGELAISGPSWSRRRTRASGPCAPRCRVQVVQRVVAQALVPPPSPTSAPCRTARAAVSHARAALGDGQVGRDLVERRGVRPEQQ